MLFFLRWLVYFIGLIWLWLCFFIGLMILMLTLLFSQLPHYRTTVEHGLNAFLTQSLSLGSVSTYWHAGQPTVTLQQTRLGDILDLAEAEMTFDLWGSLTQLQVLTQKIHIKIETLKLPTDAKTAQLNFTERILFNWLLHQPQVTIELKQLTGVPAEHSLTAVLLQLHSQKTTTHIQAHATFSQPIAKNIQLHQVAFKGQYQPTALKPLSGQLTLEQLQIFKTETQPLAAIPQLQSQVHLTAAGHIEISQLVLKHPQFQHTVPVNIRLQPTQSAFSVQFQDLFLAESHVWFTDSRLRALLKATQGRLQQCQGYYHAVDNWQMVCQLTALALQPQAELPLGFKALSAQLQLAPNQGQLTILPQPLTVQLPKWYPTPIVFEQISGQLNSYRDGQGHWHLTTENLKLTDKANTSVTLNGQLSLPQPTLKVNVALQGQLASLRQYVPSQNMPQWWPDLQINGQLATAQATLQGPLSDIQLVNAIAELKHTQLHYQADEHTEITLAIDSGQVQLDERYQGRLHLKQAQVHLSAEQLYTHPVTMTQLQGELRWQHQSQQWHISTEHLQAHHQQLPIQVKGHVAIQQGTPQTDLMIELGSTPLNQIGHYFPDKRLTRLVNWFDQALTQGHVQRGHIHLQGPVDKLLENLSAEIEVNQAHIRYNPHWPPLTQVHAQLAIEQNQLTITADQGQLLKHRIQNIEVKIPQLVTQPTQLQLSGQLAGPAHEGLKFIAQSPLHNTIALNEERFSLDGMMSVQLQLTLPLAQSPQHTTQVHGQIQFDNTTLKDKSLGINISAINGALTFTEDKVSAEQLHGQWLNTPIECSIRTAPKRTQIRINGQAHRQFLTQLLHDATWLADVSGQTQWSAILEWPHEDRADIQFSLATDLTGLAIHLPAPVGKTAAQSQQLQVQAQLSTRQPHQFKIHYGSIVNGILEIDSRGLVRGGIIFGPQAAQLPATPQLTVSGQMAQFSLTQWLNKCSAISTTPTTLTLPLLFDLHVEQLEVLGQSFTHLAIQAHYQAQRGQMAVTGDHIEGQILLVPQPNRAKLELMFKQLTLATPAQSSKTTSLDPRQLPLLSFYCQSLHLGATTLDEVNLKTYADPKGLKLVLSSTTPKDLELELQGQWYYQAKQQQTHMQLQLTSLDISQLFRQVGYQQPPIAGALGQLSAEVSWQNSPYRFEKHTLAGQLSVLMLDGHLVDIEPGTAGRVFGLFDVHTLSRRLSLDFSDVFEQGLGFTSINGFFTLKEGQAYTDDLTLQSPAARIKFQGKTDLVTHEYDQYITVVPHVSNALPVAGALAGGLGVGAAALLLQQLVQSEIERTIHYRYQVTGPWNKPQVISLSRQK